MKEKIKNTIKLFGTELCVGGVKKIALIRLMASGEAKNYLDDVEYLGVVKPAYFLIMSYDCGIGENATFSFEGRTLTVRKVTPVYLANETIYRTALAY